MLEHILGLVRLNGGDVSVVQTDAGWVVLWSGLGIGGRAATLLGALAVSLDGRETDRR